MGIREQFAERFPAVGLRPAATPAVPGLDGTLSTKPVAAPIRLRRLPVERQWPAWFIVAFQAAILLAGIGAWEVGAKMGWIDPFFWSRPSAIFATMLTFFTAGFGPGLTVEYGRLYRRTVGAREAGGAGAAEGAVDLDSSESDSGSDEGREAREKME